MIFHFANFFTAKFCHQNFAKILQNAKFRSCLITTQRRAFINFTRPAFGFMPNHESIKSLKESYPQLINLQSYKKALTLNIDVVIYDEFSCSQEIQDGLEVLRVPVDEVRPLRVAVAGDHAAVLA